ncbi:MAG: biotin/lipoyl-binding protein [Thermoanaerobacteraceae bacterium]|nr:biotin/lipoyl-binding protein [Thermoanaerobacteraceae bacterium]
MKKFRVTVNGEVYEVEVEEIGGTAQAGQAQPAPQPAITPAPMPAAAPKAAAPAPKPAAPKKPAAPTASGEQVTAPLPGTVLDIKVSVGQQVNAGDVLLTLEAMKMENEVTAGTSGEVKEILVDKGATVASGDTLVIIG